MVALDTPYSLRDDPGEYHSPDGDGHSLAPSGAVGKPGVLPALGSDNHIVSCLRNGDAEREKRIE